MMVFMRVVGFVLVGLLVACGSGSPAMHDAGAEDDAPVVTPDADVDAPPADAMCGNGVREGSEDCDFGADNGADTGCETDCTFSCADQAACDDGNPCNGSETCDAVTVNGHAGQTCAAGTALPDGDACGSGMICVAEACVASTCGDGTVTSPEECDDQNLVDVDGCDNNCRFSCVSTDSTRDCTPADACAGQGTCNDSTHQCAAGTPLADDTACGTGGYCLGGTCTQPTCNDGNLEPGETCDDGNPTNGDGCDTDCTYSCVDPAMDCGGSPPACQTYSCSAAHVCQTGPDSTQDGMTCGPNGETCTGGACTGGVCGNGIEETGEQCDFGTGNGPNTGCENDCTLSCTVPSSCDDNDPCNGTETCAAVMVMGHDGQRCVAGTPLADNTTCGTGKICRSQACVASTCGDGYVDTANGESCEPPGVGTCDAACHVIACGDGILAGDEQCDDGNLTNLDGCSSTCEFEQCHRINDLEIEFKTSFTSADYCQANALGGALGSNSQQLITDAVDAGVTDGSITVIFQMVGLDDLTGANDASLQLGVLGGTPVSGTAYDGNADLDWWYTIDPNDLDASRSPTSLAPASISNNVLTAGPANMTFDVNFVGTAVTMDMFDTRVRAMTGVPNTPTASSSGTPGHLASENLDPALTSFSVMGSQTMKAEMCGNTTAASLASTAVPATILTYCSNYTIGHTLLDLYVSGCTYIFFVPIVKATQPDTARTPGDVYHFNADGQRHVTSCTKNGQPAQMSDCLQNAGYSTYYRFTTDRMIGK